MKTSTKLAGYLFTAGVMAMSPISVFATEGSGTNGLSFYDYLAANADKDTVIDFNQAPATGNQTVEVYVPGDGATVLPVSDIGGLYMLQDTKNDEKPMYFYRGNVENNNVILNNMCWLIVRTTETGGTKLLYNGTPTDDQCLGDPDWGLEKLDGLDLEDKSTWPKTIVGFSKFNEKHDSPADFGYMYGERFAVEEKSFYGGDTVFGNDVSYSEGGYTLLDTAVGDNAYNGRHYTCLNTSNTCTEVYYAVHKIVNTGYGYFLEFTGGDNLDTALAKMAENKNDSIIKGYLENWYAENMTDVTEYLEDTIFYGSKTFASGALSTKDSDFRSNFDQGGRSYTDTIIDTIYHGASREEDSVLPLIRSDNNTLSTFGLNSTADTLAPHVDNDVDLANGAVVVEDSGQSQVDFLDFSDMVNSVSFNYTDMNGIYTVDNGTLKYPVGLLTSPEMIMAGNGYPAMAKGTYIDDAFLWWGISPFSFLDGYIQATASVFYGIHYGFTYKLATSEMAGVRPVVSMKYGIGANSGDGSKENPFTNIVEETSENGESPAVGEASPVNPQTADVFLPATLAVIAFSSFAVTAVKRNTSR